MTQKAKATVDAFENITVRAHACNSVYDVSDN